MRVNLSLSLKKTLPLGIAVLLFLPIIALTFVAFSKPSPSFSHLIDTVLWTYIKNSLILVTGVCFMALVWGLPSAWLVNRYQFFGRSFFSWALLLPMAMPAYLVAFVYTDLFDYAGVIQITIRKWFGFTSAADYWFFDMRTMSGAIYVLSLVFSPYVYWLTRINLSQQCQSHIQAAKLLGASEVSILFRIVLPLARPAIVVACTLVTMETLADFGTVSYFSVWHITTAIYNTWLTHFDLSGAAKLSLILLLFIVTLIIIEKRSRAKLNYGKANRQINPTIKLSKGRSFLASFWCFIVFFLGFLLPFLVIIQNAIIYFSETDWPIFYRILRQSLGLASSVAGTAVIIALLLQSTARLYPSRTHQFSKGISGLGYAVPGTVLAIGVLITTTQIDHRINDVAEWLGFSRPGLLLSGTLVAMAYAFVVRFSAISLGTVESGLSQISTSLDKTAVLYGYGFTGIMKRIFIPLLKNSLLTAFLLVFLESLKELSAAILLRPFNVETLSTYVYQYMSTEEFDRAALPALIMVIAGLPAVLLLVKAMEKSQHE